MVRTRDPMLTVFRHRDDPAAREAYQQAVEQEAADRNAATKGKKASKAGKRKKAGKTASPSPTGRSRRPARPSGFPPPAA